MSTQDIINVEIVERELFEVAFQVIDVLPTVSLGIEDLNDVLIQNLLNGQYLRYNSTTQKWENVTLETLIDEKLVYNELPTKINSKVFQTVNNYQAGKIQVFLNGIKEHYFTETGANEITFDEDTVNGDIVEVNYIKN